MSENGNGGGFRAAASLIAAGWPIFLSAILALIGYIEVRSDAKVANAIRDHDTQIIARDNQYLSRNEWEARRAETDRRLDDAAQNDRLLNDRLGRIEAAIGQLTVSVEAIRQRQEDDRRVKR